MAVGAAKEIYMLVRFASRSESASVKKVISLLPINSISSVKNVVNLWLRPKCKRMKWI